MAEHDDGLVVSKASTVQAEGLPVTLGPGGSSSITPATLVVMCGMKNGTALQVPAVVTESIGALNDFAASIASTQAELAANIQAAATALEAQTSKIMSGMASYFNQAMSHVADSEAIKSVTSFMNEVDFPDLGSGIKDMASLADQGLSNALGSLSSAASVMESAGKVFDVSNMATFGTSGGLVESVISNKLANYSGLNIQLESAGVDLTQIHDPSYKSQIDSALSNITDPGILDTVTDQYGLPSGSISSLHDLTDVTKLAGDAAAGLTGGISGLAGKLSDLGASFTSPTAASDMLKGLDMPSVPALASAAPSLPALASNLNPCMQDMTGGFPSIGDFMSTVIGNPLIEGFKAAAATAEGITQSMIDELHAQMDNVSNLFDKAGMSLSDPAPPLSLSTNMAFSTSLLKHGTDSLASDVIGKLANTSNAAGQAVVASLSEGKNRALMAANGISPIKFG
jgi:hypothetical protein